MMHKLSPSCVEAFNQGFEAAFNGLDECFDNPHPRGSDEFLSWNDGYHNFFEQQEQQQRSKYLRGGPVESDDPVLARLQALSMAEIGTLIGSPAEEWPSRCFEIASAIVKALEWPDAEAVYGLYLGPISRHCTVFTPSSAAMVRHGWIVTKDGYLIDPTAWVFEAAEPYIKVLQPRTTAFYDVQEHYDEGAESLAGAARQEFPAYQDGEEAYAVPSPSLLALLQALARRNAGFGVALHPTGFSRAQLGWLCRTPYSALGIASAAELYAYVKSHGLGVCVPVDYQTRANRNARWAITDE